MNQTRRKRRPIWWFLALGMAGLVPLAAGGTTSAQGRSQTEITVS